MPASIVWASMRQNRNTETASSGVTVFSTAIFTIPAPQKDERGDGAGHGRRIRAASFPVSDQRVYA